MNMTIVRLIVVTNLWVIAVLCTCTSSNAAFMGKKVHEIAAKLPDLPNVNVADPDRFLNDLELSPMWKVEKTREGAFVAKARSIQPDNWDDGSGRMFLFEFMALKDRRLPKDYRIRNAYLEGAYLDGHRKTFSSFNITVVFRKPDRTDIAFGQSGQKVTLGIYEPFEKMIGPNSVSCLAIKLSDKHEIYVILQEGGSDPTRSTTFAKLPLALRELADIASSPAKYRVEKRYKDFFELFFQLPLKDHELKRFPGLQDRDTFYGYFRAHPNTSYSGINIKISHPIYCPDEGTAAYARLDKAEYLGKPYYGNDVLFFLIEDNAVYLSEKYDKQFGTFTGTDSFDGTLQILNDAGEVLLKTTDKFKGWQR